MSGCTHGWSITFKSAQLCRLPNPLPVAPANCAAGVDPVHGRHVQVEQAQAEGVFLDGSEGFLEAALSAKAKAQLEEKKQEVTKKVEEKAKEKLDGVLKGLFK